MARPEDQYGAGLLIGERFAVGDLGLGSRSMTITQVRYSGSWRLTFLSVRL